MKYHRIIEMFAICRQLHLSYSVQKYSFYLDYEKKIVILHPKIDTTVSIKHRNYEY